jgi:putative transposase
MKNVDGPAVRLVDETDAALAAVLPESLAVQLGGIAEACREGLNEEADALCGGWNARDPERDHVRGGTTPTSVVMGGQRLPIRRPRVHAVEDGERAGEVGLTSYGVFAQGDLLGRVAVERMLAGVATRSFARVADPIGDKARAAAKSTSKSAVSRRFVTGTRKALDQLLGRDLSGLDAAVLMIDGVDFAGAMCVVALVVTADGTKVPVGLRLGDTENSTVVTALLADIVDRGLDYSGGLLVVIDGAKALASATRKVFGDLALIQRCQIHKRRNVKGHLPARLRRRSPARRVRRPRPAHRAGQGETVGRRARQDPSGCGRVVARGPRGHVHRPPPRHRRDPGPHPGVHEHDRVDDLDLSHDQRQREALARRVRGWLRADELG